MIEFITRYWLETLFGGLIALLGIGYRILYKRVKEQEAVKLGVQALLPVSYTHLAAAQQNALYQFCRS